MKLDNPSISEEVLGLGVTVVLHLIDAISCTTADCLIWDFNLSEGDAWYKIFFWLSLIIVVPMFLYGIFKSILLYKILMFEIVAVNKILARPSLLSDR